MEKLLKPFVVSDKETDDGHRAHFLGHKNDLAVPFSVAGLRDMAQDLSLSSADTECFDALVTSLENENRLPYPWTPQEQHFVDHKPKDLIVPYIIYRYKFRTLPQLREITKTPVHVAIEPASLCNLRCPMCFQVDKTFTQGYPMGLMEVDLFKDIIDQAEQGGTGAITIGSRGEPFLNKNLGEMLRFVSDKKSFFDVKINTNATKMEEQDCHDLLSSNLNLIILSIDAHEKELYEAIRVRANFEQVLENVRRLHEIRKKHYPDSRAEIRISGVHIREEQDEEGFREFWSEYCDNIVYVRAQERWDTYGNKVHPDNNSPCLFLWERLLVCFDGTCNPCDEDYKTMLSPGNIKEMPLAEIWQGPEMVKIRKDHLTDQRNCHMPCDRCGV